MSTTEKKRKATKPAAKVAKVAKPAVKAKAAKPAARPLLDKQELSDEEAKLRQNYPKIVKGSLRNVGDDPKKRSEWKGKRTVEVECAKRGCHVHRRIATSDLHQVTMCTEHTMEARLARRREARRAKAEKPK